MAPRPMSCKTTTLRSWLVRIAVCGVAFAFLWPEVSVPIALAIIGWPLAPLRSVWGRVELLAALGWLASSVIRFSDTGIGLEIAVYLMSGGVLGLSWMIRTLSMVPPIRGFRRPPSQASRAALLAWIAVPLCGLTGVILLGTDIDLQFRLWFSERALVEAAQSPTSSIPSPHWPRHIGLFEVYNIQVDGGVPHFTTSNGFLEYFGVVHSPAGPPVPSGDYRYRHLFGPWYQFVWSW